MAFLDTTHLDRKPTSPIAFEALMAQLDRRRPDITRQVPGSDAGAPAHRRQVQQMLVAAAGAAALIVAVAGAMMLSLL